MIKEKIKKSTNIPTAQQRLITGNNQMNDNKLANDYKLIGGSVLYLILALRGGGKKSGCGCSCREECKNNNCGCFKSNKRCTNDCNCEGNCSYSKYFKLQTQLFFKPVEKSSFKNYNHLNLVPPNQFNNNKSPSLAPLTKTSESSKQNRKKSHTSVFGNHDEECEKQEIKLDLSNKKSSLISNQPQSSKPSKKPRIDSLAPLNNSPVNQDTEMQTYNKLTTPSTNNHLKTDFKTNQTYKLKSSENDELITTTSTGKHHNREELIEHLNKNLTDSGELEELEEFEVNEIYTCISKFNESLNDDETVIIIKF